MLNPLVRAPRATDLTVPVGTLMRPTLFVETGDSLSRGAQTLRENGGCLLPVVDENGALRGILTDAGLARALAEMTEATDAVADFLEVPQTLPPYAAAAEALRRGEDGATLVVVDDARRPVGLVSASDLWPRRRRLPRPAMVGGMATPFGVYLTSGNASAGAPWWALAATGASMFGMLVVGVVAADQASRAGLPASWSGALAIVLFLAFMRLSPLSGTHGAEHQVVHAIEREEALVESVVSRMPRVHPRCGTNLMAGLAVFFGVREVFAHVPGLAEAGWVLSFIVAMAFAMPLGAVAQRYVTTKTPTPKQLRGAIAAGEALLLANATARHSKATPLRRIVSAGVLQVMAGAVAAIGLVALLKALTRWSWLPDLS